MTAGTAGGGWVLQQAGSHARAYRLPHRESRRSKRQNNRTATAVRFHARVMHAWTRRREAGRSLRGKATQGRQIVSGSLDRVIGWHHGHGHPQRVVSCHSRAGLLVRVYLALPLRAVARVGVWMAGWAGRTGLRSWWCDGVRGQAVVCVHVCRVVATRLGQPWSIRQGREGEGVAAGTWHLASGIWHAATQAPKNFTLAY